MQQSLLQYIERPALLSEITSETLLELISRYPYSTNLRLLILLKARQENDPNYESYLNRFASATFDRAHLYNLLASLDLKEEERGEVLELLELEELELQPLDHAFNEELPSRLNELPTPPPPAPSPVVDYEGDSVNLPPVVPSTPAFTRPVPAARSGMTDWVAVAVSYSQLLPGLVRAARPEDPATFRAVVGRRTHNHVNLSDRLRKLRRRQQAVPAKKPSPDSGSDAGVVVSETLAALLVRQEQYQAAIKMYRRLILLYPEKKPIFAGLIEKLKEKL